MTLQAAYIFKEGKAAHDVEIVNTANKMITEIKDLCLAQSSTHTHTNAHTHIFRNIPGVFSQRVSLIAVCGAEASASSSL